MTLVTDMGYATHDEIVWESLVDVNGAAAEMFSGDFRGVSHAQDVRLSKTTSPSSPPPPPLPGPRPTGAVPGGSRDADDVPVVHMTEEQRKAAEQEDHDLALALQLQEEEEDRQRQDQERRRREQELSEQFLSNESEGPRPPIPPRRSGRGNNGSSTSVGTGATSNSPSTQRPSAQSRPSVTIPVTITPSTTTTSAAPATRPPVNRPADEAGDPDAPPSYEQAASDRPYRPAGSTAPATLTQGNAIGAYDALRRQSAYAQASQASLPSFADAGPASPPYTPATYTGSASANAGRRQSMQGRNPSFGNTNQGNRRGSTQIGFSVPPQRTQPGQGGLAPGHFPGSMQARSTERLQAWNRAQQPPPASLQGGGAAGVKDAEEKCVVM